MPIAFYILVHLAILLYRLFPTFFTYYLQSILLAMATICFIIALPLFAGALLLCVYKLIFKKRVSKFLNYSFVFLAIYILSAFLAPTIISGPISKFIPEARLDPFMHADLFSQETWESDKLKRRAMVGNLVENFLPNKNCMEIKAILGVSLDKNYGNSQAPFDCLSGRESELRYFLGSIGLFGDIDNIRIFFDEAGNYSSYEIYSYDW